MCPRDRNDFCEWGPSALVLGVIMKKQMPTVVGDDRVTRSEKLPELRQRNRRLLSELARLKAAYVRLNKRCEEMAANQTARLERDLHDRRTAEFALNEQKQLLHDVTNVNPNPIFVKDSGGRFTLVNKAMAEFYGTTPTAIVGKTDRDLNGKKAEVERILFQDKKVIESARCIHIPDNEYTSQKTGQISWFQIAGRVASFRDNAVRKEAEFERRRSLDGLDAIRDGVFMFSPSDLRFCYVNEGAVEQTGYDRGQLLRMTPLDIAPEFTDVSFRQMIEPMIVGAVESNTFATVHQHINGSEIPVEIILHLVAVSEGHKVFVAVVRDATSRVEAERVLAKANKKAIQDYERLLERIAKLAGSVGLASDLETIYRALKDFVRDSIPGTELFISLNCENHDVCAPVYAVRDGAEIDVSLLTEKEMSDNSPCGRAISTGLVILENDLQPAIHSGLEGNPNEPRSCIVAPMSVMGQVVGAVTVLSPQSGAYTEIDAIALRMAGNIAANAVESVRLCEQAEESAERLRESQKLEAIGTVTGGVAHDFNNLLTAILGNTQLAARSLSPGDPVQLRLSEVVIAGNRAAELTSKLLAFSRRQHLERRTININDTLEEIMRLIERIIGEDVEIEVICGDDLPTVFGDSTQIGQVIMNLAINARDAMPDGGQLTLETSLIELDQKHRFGHPFIIPGMFVEVRVSDTGSGLDKETMSRVFEPYFTTKEVGKGTGLGLSMAYGIMKQHDGYITVDSEPGEGANFRVFLPIDSKPVVEVPIRSRSLLGGTETILIAEDERVLRQLANDIMEDLGYTVLLAEDGVEAVEIFRANPDLIDLFLTDVIMPQMGGAQAYEKISEIAGRDIPLIFMTGYSIETIQSRFVSRSVSAEGLGATIIQKPYTIEVLGRTVREVLDKSKMPN